MQERKLGKAHNAMEISVTLSYPLCSKCEAGRSVSVLMDDRMDKIQLWDHFVVSRCLCSWSINTARDWNSLHPSKPEGSWKSPNSCRNEYLEKSYNLMKISVTSSYPPCSKCEASGPASACMAERIKLGFLVERMDKIHRPLCNFQMFLQSIDQYCKRIKLPVKQPNPKNREVL